MLRALSAQSYEDWKLLANSGFYANAVARGDLVKTEEVTDRPDWLPPAWREHGAVLEHARIPVISYPYEWPFSLLKAAAALHLRLLIEALPERLISKDGSAYNIQFDGIKPVFIDIGSLTKQSPGEPWQGYLQFCETLMFPLMLRAHLDIPHGPWLRGQLEGIAPAQMANLFRGMRRFRPGVFKHVYLQSRLQDTSQRTNVGVRRELKTAGFSDALILNNLTNMHELIQKLQWQPDASTWLHYEDMGHYSGEDRQKKDEFVHWCLALQHWPLVWDLGTNTGRYAQMAAAEADYVVACDADEAAVDRLVTRLAEQEIGNVLPLVVDLADPPGGIGWRNRERLAFVERSQPELILCLALIHHLVIGANIPLEDFVGWLADRGAALLVEFVHPADPMVAALLSSRSQDYEDYSQARFEAALSQRLRIHRQVELGSRTMYYATPG